MGRGSGIHLFLIGGMDNWGGVCWQEYLKRGALMVAVVAVLTSSSGGNAEIETRFSSCLNFCVQL